MTSRGSRLAFCAVLVAAAVVVLARPSASPAASARPRIIGGDIVSVTTAPWQVYVLHGSDYACGGSILDAQHILTAAHCANHGGTAPVAPASEFNILAGSSDVSTWAPGQPAPAGTQASGVSSLRIHPYYDPATSTDDVMVLTLTTPLTFGPNVQPIGLPGPGTAVAAGAALRVTGFGQSSASPTPDGKLRALGVNALADDDCRADLATNSAVAFCAVAPGGAPCFGDSGGPLTTVGSPAVQVGVVSYASSASCSGPTAFVDVAAPEVRAFIDGAASVPRAARQQTVAQLLTVLPPVQGSPLSCNPGTWDGAPSYTYTFRVDGGPVRQSGPTPTYIPQAQDVGAPLVCVVEAANAGGTSTARTGTTPPIQRDTVGPRSRILSLRCSRRTCRVRLAAVDPNSRGTLSMTATATYHARGTCKSRHSKRRHRCTVTRRRHFTSRFVAGQFRVTATRLPYRAVKFAFVARDAAGNRQHRATGRTVTLHRRRSR